MTTTEELVTQCKLELWFRKDPPASFDEMVLTQRPDAFWIEPLNAPCIEYGDNWDTVFFKAFFGFGERVVRRGRIKLRLGHSDLIVAAGPVKLGCLVVNENQIQVPLRWYPRCTRLDPLKLVHLDQLRQ